MTRKGIQDIFLNEKKKLGYKLLDKLFHFYKIWAIFMVITLSLSLSLYIYIYIYICMYTKIWKAIHNCVNSATILLVLSIVCNISTIRMDNSWDGDKKSNSRTAYSKSKTNTDQAYLNNKVSEMKKKLKIVKPRNCLFQMIFCHPVENITHCRTWNWKIC